MSVCDVYVWVGGVCMCGCLFHKNLSGNIGNNVPGPKSAEFHLVMNS